MFQWIRIEGETVKRDKNNKMVYKNSGAVGRPFTTPFKINNNDNDNNNNDDESRCANSITFSNVSEM